MRLFRPRLTAAVLAGLLLTALPAPYGTAAEGMNPPRISVADVDWTKAIEALAAMAELRSAVVASTAPPAQSDAAGIPPELSRLNTAMAARFPGIAASPVPMLLPFDTEALLRDLAEGKADEGSERYLSGFRFSKFFHPGPAGYDVAFTLLPSEISNFADIKYPEPIEIQISSSALLYELDGSALPAGLPELEPEFPGIKRLIHEHHVRYTFVRYGAPYVVSVRCLDSRVARYRMPTCRAADRVAVHLMKALRVAGGTPSPSRTVEPAPVERPDTLSTVFRYRSPGKLLSGTGLRDRDGRADYTVYARIRFPLANAPTHANSQMFQARNPAPNHGYPWRDNFCERRAFPVGQCPAGFGHQGQDIRPAPCWPQPCRAHDQLVAVRDGAILRAPKQEAAHLFVNSATEHLRFRYLHMNPRQMNADRLLSGRRCARAR